MKKNLKKKKKGTEPICRTGIETQMWRMDLRTQAGKQRVGKIERAAVTHMHYHVQNRKLPYNTGSSAQCSAMTWRGAMEVGGREVQEKRDICMRIVDSLCCTAETYTMLHSKLIQHFIGTIILQLKKKLKEKKLKGVCHVFHRCYLQGDVYELV